MEFLKDETKAAIAGDPFAVRAIETARLFIYLEYRNWEKISREGKILFVNEPAWLTYLALSVLLGKAPENIPDVADATIRLGGVEMKAKFIDELASAVSKGHAKAVQP